VSTWVHAEIIIDEHVGEIFDRLANRLANISSVSASTSHASRPCSCMRCGGRAAYETNLLNKREIYIESDSGLSI